MAVASRVFNSFFMVFSSRAMIFNDQEQKCSVYGCKFIFWPNLYEKTAKISRPTNPFFYRELQVTSSNFKTPGNSHGFKIYDVWTMLSLTKEVTRLLR